MGLKDCQGIWESATSSKLKEKHLSVPAERTSVLSRWLSSCTDKIPALTSQHGRNLAKSISPIKFVPYLPGPHTAGQRWPIKNQIKTDWWTFRGEHKFVPFLPSKLHCNFLDMFTDGCRSCVWKRKGVLHETEKRGSVEAHKSTRFLYFSWI